MTKQTIDVASFDGSPALRSHGILLALLEYFKAQRVPKRDTVFHVTDLNLVLLLNSYAQEREVTVGLGPEQNDMAKELGERLISFPQKRTIMFKYSPLRIQRGDNPPAEVFDSVTAADFHIYPCPCESFLDALEVRFLVPGRLTHAFFLDFGQREAKQYVKKYVQYGQ